MDQGTVQLAVRVPPKMRADLRALAHRMGTNINHEANVALRAHIDASRALLKGAKP